MPTFSSDGVDIHYQVAGQGYPLVWSHEFAGDITSWEPQVNFFSRRYQIITYCHRGYPPSGVPGDPAAYSQDHLVEDLNRLLQHLGIEQAYIGGLSMGGTVAISFAIAHPEMCRALIVASAGAGSNSGDRERLLASWQALSESMIADGMEKFADGYARGPERVQFLRKDPVGWAKFHAGLASHSAQGSSLTFRGVQMKRPTIYELEKDLQQIKAPTLVLIGDEDTPCVEPAIFMKRSIPACGLAVFPQSGHTINLEEPGLYNRTVLDFLTAVEAGKWVERG
ncbi:MAG: alpha/beta fold hydrolase [Chloroflexi bacterium]|nr:alpha/beta fold hydrolase [Chloroflexota bacterium]